MDKYIKWEKDEVKEEIASEHRKIIFGDYEDQPV